LPTSPARAEVLIIEAVILDRQCRPAADAEVHVWHTDARGLYGPSDAQECCYYDGTVRSDGDGRFRLRTIRPAQYPVPAAPPAHIHLEIRHPAGDLQSEITFEATSVSDPVLPTGHDLAVPLRKDSGGWRGEAVFVLAGTG
jgi:protocatechuate 3,4-dioxygenase beta subunit